jgi:hypothetical protein
MVLPPGRTIELTLSCQAFRPENREGLENGPQSRIIPANYPANSTRA